MADIKKEYERWLENATADADVATELKTLDDTKIEDAFYRDLAFGTGGLRGVIGAGTNRMNMVWQQEKTINLRGGMMLRKMQLSFRSKMVNKVLSRLKDVQLDITSIWSYNTSKWT